MQRILCPTDFSDNAFKAVRHAAAIARWHGAELHVLHVTVDVVAPAKTVGGPMPLVIVRETTPEVERRLHDWLGEAGISESLIAKGAVTLVVRDGVPASAIVRYAADAAIDLIVLGVEGLSHIERAALGSVAERVLHKAPCPVLTIPPGSARAVDHPAVAFTHVLCAIDFSEQSRGALDRALALARESHARLTLLHVMETLSDEEARMQAHYRVGEFVGMRRREIAAELEQLVPASARVVLRPDVRVEVGRPAQTILGVSERLGVDLIVMGAQGRGALGALVFGSATQTVVRRATVPVLTVGRLHSRIVAA